MPRFLLLFCVLWGLAPTEAEACDFGEANWILAVGRASSVLMPPGDTLVLLLEAPNTSAKSPAAPLHKEYLEMTASRDSLVVAGSATSLEKVAGGYRAVIKWEQPLEAGTYTLSGLDEVFNPSDLPLEVREPDRALAPVITKFEAREWKTGIDEVCCEVTGNECFDYDSCGDADFCDRCWPTAWSYPVAGNAFWRPEGMVVGEYDYEVFLLNDDGVEQFFERGFPGQVSLNWVVFEEGWSGERCVRVDAIHYETEERLTGAVRCLDDYGTVERDKRDPPSEHKDCEGPVVDAQGNEVDVGCAVAGGSAPLPVVLGLALVVVARRRARVRTIVE